MLLVLLIAALLAAACGGGAPAATSPPPAPPTDTPVPPTDTPVQSIPTEQPTQMPQNVTPGTCADARFTLTDLGPVLTASDLATVGGTPDSPIADSTAVVLADGAVRMFVGARGLGTTTAISDDGLDFTFENSGSIFGREGYGMPKVLTMDDGSFRVFTSEGPGIKMFHSTDGVTMEFVDIVLTTEQSGFDYRPGKFLVVPLAAGGYRAYYDHLGLGAGQGFVLSQIKSATSDDLLKWTVEAGDRFGTGAAHLTGSSREPMPLQWGDDCLTLFYVRDDLRGQPTQIYYAHTEDGVTFTEGYALNLPRQMAGPNLIQLQDGIYLMYFDSHDDDIGFHVRASLLEFVE